MRKRGGAAVEHAVSQRRGEIAVYVACGRSLSTELPSGKGDGETREEAAGAHVAARPLARHSPLGRSARRSLGAEFGTGHELGDVQVGVQERIPVLIRLAPKLSELRCVLDVEHLPDLGLGCEVHVLLVLRLLVHSRAEVSELVYEVRVIALLQKNDGTRAPLRKGPEGHPKSRQGEDLSLRA